MPAVATPAERIKLEPQPKQREFLSSPADICVGGGAAGGGKSWSLLFEPLRHVRRPGFTGLVLRKTFPEITGGGGLLDESAKAYPYLGGTKSGLTWNFPAGKRDGAKIQFGHCQHDQDVRKYLGNQFAYIGFDQLETFSQATFFYLLSRNRSVCGIRPYVRATANPEPGWLADFLAYWIDPEGYPDPARCGRLRWMVRLDDEIRWADSWDALYRTHRTRVLPPGVYQPDDHKDERVAPNSVTFVPFGLDDNPILCRSDPSYRAKLEAMSHVEKMRLLKGNWRISSAGGEWPADYFAPDIWAQDEQFPRKREDYLITALACDPSKGRSTAEHRPGDYCAFVWAGLDRQQVLWVDAWLDRWPAPRIAEVAFDLYAKTTPHGIGFEANQFQELLAHEFARLSLARRYHPAVYALQNNDSKRVRIRRLGTYLAQHRLRFRHASPGCRLLVQQLQQFGPVDSSLHDDGPDALEQCIRLCDFLLNGPGGVCGQVPRALEFYAA